MGEQGEKSYLLWLNFSLSLVSRCADFVGVVANYIRRGFARLAFFWSAKADFVCVLANYIRRDFLAM